MLSADSYKLKHHLLLLVVLSPTHVWGDYMLIRVMIPAGIGHCFGSDVNVI